MNTSNNIYFCDFETTVYEGQKDTQVWSACIVKIDEEEPIIFKSIEEFFDYVFSIKNNSIFYFHNLKFDGTFILSYLLNTDLVQAFEGDKIIDRKEMLDNSFNYVISMMGDWYSITIKKNGHYYTIRDSLKLLPFSLERIGESFNTKHKKLEMEYKGYRFSGCEISKEEEEYIKNDVLVLKEAMLFMFNSGHKRLTIGSCCMSEFKDVCSFTKEEQKYIFPNLYEIEIQENLYGSKTAGDYIHKSYRGGWCYLVKGKENKKFNNGLTIDVNSLYPSMMHSESGNYYPVGYPTFWKGNFIPEEARGEYVFGNYQENYYFIRIKTRFKLKSGMLPVIQIKNNAYYRQNEYLETSDLIFNGKRLSKLSRRDGKEVDFRVELTLTKTDYNLILEHYNLYDFEILDGCYFNAETMIFDSYINKYKRIKLENKGAKRELAKLFLNNLYGKFAMSPDSSYKIAQLDKDGVIVFKDVKAREKTPGYIAIGSAITSYAREFTIRAAQNNYYGKDKQGFIYADTDSIHCDLKKEDLKAVSLHDTDFCKWKLECEWDEALFCRQKTYIERVINTDEKQEQPYYSIKCAGMPSKSKYLLNLSLTGHSPIKKIKLSKEEKNFVSKRRSIEDFKTGLKVPGKLIQKRIKGGCVLVDTTFEIK